MSALMSVSKRNNCVLYSYSEYYSISKNFIEDYLRINKTNILLEL